MASSETKLAEWFAAALMTLGLAVVAGPALVAAL